MTLPPWSRSRRSASCPASTSYFPTTRWFAVRSQGLRRRFRPAAIWPTPANPGIPQLELIARALTSHREGQAWIMRRRTQAEMDQLVEAAGFRKIEQRIDEWGIFTVSLAQRMGP